MKPLKRSATRHSATQSTEDIQLKFDGDAITRLGGAPAESVIRSLNALQRLVHLIGMKSEGQALGQRVKPRAKVRRDYAVICKAPIAGSHVQPFKIASQAGISTYASVEAGKQLLTVLKAFDSENDQKILEVIPSARERWFIADAASGLIPDAESEIIVSIRQGAFGPFSFKSVRASSAIERFREGAPPDRDEVTIVGKLSAVDFGTTIATVRPSKGRAVKFSYPLMIERMLQQNARKRISIEGTAGLNNAGDIVGFSDVKQVRELEASLTPITEFPFQGRLIRAARPLSIPIAYDAENRVFVCENRILGIRAEAESYDDIRPAVIEDCQFIWEQYALESNDILAADAQAVKANFHTQFKAS